jgi:hypothetical protein
MTDYRIWPATNGPVSSSADSPVNLGTLVQLSATGWATRLWYYRPDTNIQDPDAGAIFAVGGGGTPVSGTQVSAWQGPTTGWRYADISPAVQLSAGDYLATAHYVDGYPATAGYWVGNSINNGILTALDSTAVNGRFSYGALLAEPTSNGGGASYWVDVTVTDTDPSGSQTISPTSISSAEAFGTPTVTPGPVTISPFGIASTEAFGVLTVTGGRITPRPNSGITARPFTGITPRP